MNTFREYCEQRDQQLEEGLGRWAGGVADKVVGGAGKLAGRMSNAAVSGLGTGLMQGAKRGWNTMMQGQGANQNHKWGMQAQKAAMSGDPQQFLATAKTIYKQMSQAQGQAQAPPQAPPQAGSTMGQAGMGQQVA